MNTAPNKCIIYSWHHGLKYKVELLPPTHHATSSLALHLPSLQPLMPFSKLQPVMDSDDCVNGIFAILFLAPLNTIANRILCP